MPRDGRRRVCAELGVVARLGRDVVARQATVGRRVTPVAGLVGGLIVGASAEALAFAPVLPGLRRFRPPLEPRRRRRGAAAVPSGDASVPDCSVGAEAVFGWGSALVSCVVVSSDIDQSFAHVACVVRRMRCAIGGQRFVPRAVALDPLLRAKYPVSGCVMVDVRDAMEQTEQLRWPDAAWFRCDFGVEEVVVEHDQLEDSGAEVFDDGPPLARRLDAKLVRRQRLRDGVVQHTARERRPVGGGTRPS